VQGRITLGCDVTSVSFPAKCIADFNEKYPNIIIDVKQFDGADRNQAIISGEYDFCFMPRDMVPESSGIETLITHYENLAVVTRSNGKFKDRKSVNLRDIAGEKLLLLSESICPIVYMEIMDLLRTFHISSPVESSFDELVSMYVAVASGLGVSIVPQSLALYASSDYSDIFQIEDADTSIVYVMAWEKIIANPAAKLFIESVKKYAKGEDNIYGL
jgi:DNA-binding transcriptional LysR family regulator